MRTKILKNIINVTLMFSSVILLSVNGFSQSCHGTNSPKTTPESGIHNHEKSSETRHNYKCKKEKYYVCKTHKEIRSENKGLCSVCNKKLKKKLNYIY